MLYRFVPSIIRLFTIPKAHRVSREMSQTSTAAAGSSSSRDDAPPDWMRLQLPPAHVLSHLTDAHCHPTDLDQPVSAYDATSLGGIAAMATEPENQKKVKSVSEARPWKAGDMKASASGSRIIACFGYHPWFTHRYTLHSSPPTKEEHYTSLFFPTHTSSTPPPTDKGQLLTTLLPYLPEPIPFDPLLDRLRDDLQGSLDQGNLTMLGEVGLDGGARLRWPPEARHLHPSSKSEPRMDEDGNGDGEGEAWNVLTSFKTSMAHQTAILEKQLELAIDLGVNISFHSVAASGPTFEVLKKMRDKHRTRFTNRINVDLHSGGGFSPNFWSQTERNFLNVYASPSIFITSRSPYGPDLIRAISPDRILVESDSHDLELCTRAVWGAADWISRCKEWKLESEETKPWSLADTLREEEIWEDKEVQRKGRMGPEGDGAADVFTVKTLERNFARFMRLVAD